MLSDIHYLLAILSFIGIMVWVLVIKHNFNCSSFPVEKPDNRPAVDRLLETLTYHNELLEELIERLIRIEDHLIEDSIN